MATPTAPHGEPWPPAVVGLLFGLGSCLSFPIGAAVAIHSASAPPEGVKASLVAKTHLDDLEYERRNWIAGALAFGAGLLLFAVTVDLYGEAMATLESQKDTGHTAQAVRSIFLEIVCAFLGAAGYIVLNRRLQAWMLSSAGHCAESSPFERTPLRHSSFGSIAGSTADLELPLSETGVANRALKSAMLGMESWFGVFISGIPEGVLLGNFAAKGDLSIVFVISLFVSNFPVALASACLLKEGNRSNREILGLWTIVFFITGCLAGVWPLLVPAFDGPGMQIFSCIIEGLAGGSMLASICAVMLPEAYLVQGDVAGLMTVCGFLAAVVIKVFGGLVQDWTTRAPSAQPSPPLLLQGGAEGLVAEAACRLIARLLGRCG
mmetsp:Transcript_61072/g.175956  ORF Transcript_61072/g.175956 Transcript_61072/m.175956 type:complete len:378 (-) Transcript_61072:177-1310(-)